jgi:phenylacetate-CoA ligase
MVEAPWDPKIEQMPRKELQDLQLKRLKKILEYVYRNNRFYRDRLKEAKVDYNNFKSIKDIEKIPFLNKDDLRGFYPFGLVCTEVDDIVEVHASSGTTGKPVVGPYTRNDVELWGEVMARSLWANGLRKSDIMQNAYGYGLFTGAHGFEKGAQKIGAMVITISSGNTKRQVTVMKDFSTTALVCTPSYSLYMAETAEYMGFDPLKDFDLRIGCFGAEAWSEEMRKNVEKRWGILWINRDYRSRCCLRV